MIGLCRALGLGLALASISLPASSQDADALFAEGVEFLRQGKDEEALARFTQVLAAEPDHESAYEMWKSTDEDMWLTMLVKGGQFELFAKRVMSLSELARSERENDAEGIRALLRRVTPDNDVVDRKRAVRELGANYGEYAVPHMLYSLGDPDDEERRVLMMHSLTEMDSDVVLPLVAAMNTDDAFLRRNVALTLGYIADPRAAGALTWVALNDDDPGVEMAAKAAAIKCGSNGDPLPLFEQLGDDYHHGRGNVLRAHFHSDVVWSWADDGLVATAVPRALYADELAKAAYSDALRVDPQSVAARAGLVRAYVSQQAEMAARLEAGLDGEGVEDQLAEASIAVNTAGVSALDLALGWSVETGDVQTGIELCRVLGAMAPEPTAGLTGALRSADGGLAAEAALALGTIAYENGRGASGDTTAGLGRAAGLEVLRMAVVIDSDGERGAAVADSLAGRGMIATHWGSGAKGLALLHRVPGVDAILIADQLDDLTAAQVLDSVRGNERTAEVPVFLISADADAGDMYDGVAGTISGPDGAAAVEEGMSAGLGHDRDQANALAARAAETLAALAYGAGGRDISPAVDDLTSTLAARPDSVTVPAMRALSAAGGAAQVPALLAVLGDAGRSDAARTSAADALAGIAGRQRLDANEDILSTLGAVLGSDASLGVRTAASRALGRLGMDPSQRAGFTQGARVNVSQ
ncbi:MAG: HEAT repeat domain-containing protein [Planctomycetota bacterium]|jgi:hypothetical protein|nr:HEAT repeat domain-containing protein [Planctomycetota bacterium]MDP6761705.1 HEAT repeat domain-containing protein [Planctomycetota bacterium]MDP6990181.1 HEAT repeat domain-containing protein [Planctomycetota bacterium]